MAMSRVQNERSFHSVRKSLLARQHAQYKGLSFVQEQQRLRIRLRHLLLQKGAAPSPLKPTRGHSANAVCTSNELWDWKRAAVERDYARRQRHASAIAIQRLVRRWLAALSDVELPSTSEFIGIPIDEMKDTFAAEDQRNPKNPRHPSLATNLDQTVLPCCLPITNGSFQVIIELLGARDLITTHHSYRSSVSAVVCVVCQPSGEVLGCLEAPETELSSSNNEGFQWDGQVLQVELDQERISAEAFLEQCCVTVELSASDSKSATVVGCLSVAMDLLETPLAEGFAMTRWFPLEVSRGGGFRPVRGEVRLGIWFLMRNPKRSRDDDDVWVPFASCKPAEPPAKSAKKSSVKRPPSGKPPLSPRKSTLLEKSSVRMSRASPPRLARVEVMSPPSSPSSYSSDSNTRESEFSPPRTSTPPSPKRSQSPLRRQTSAGIVSTSKARQARTGTVGVETTAVQSGQTDEDSPKKLFLKRKPYKVVFQKLDWSRVASKTDSNWGNGSKQGKSTAASPRRGSSQTTTAGIHSLSPGKPKPAIDDKIARVADLLYASCKVTAQTAGLAQMRFKAERKRWLPRSLSQDESAAINDMREQHLHALWKELQDDVDGSRYVELLGSGPR